jgi:hypothetical protein
MNISFLHSFLSFHTSLPKSSVPRDSCFLSAFCACRSPSHRCIQRPRRLTFLDQERSSRRSSHLLLPPENHLQLQIVMCSFYATGAVAGALDLRSNLVLDSVMNCLRGMGEDADVDFDT